MERFLLLFAFCLALFSFQQKASAQDFVGFNTSPYAGINAVDIQPASIVGTVYKLDVTVAGASLFAWNNALKFNPKVFWKWRFQNKEGVATELDTNGTDFRLLGHSRVQLPSFLLDINHNHAIGFTMQARAGVQMENLSPQFSKLFFEDFDYQPYMNNTYQANGLDTRMMSWTEIGLTYGYLAYFNQHRIKIGARVKHLGGINAFYLNADNLSYQVNQDTTLNINDSNFNYGHSDNFDPIKFKFQSLSAGLDFGVKYSYKNRFIVGASLLDFGRLRYDKAAASADFYMDQQNWDIRATEFDGLESFDDTLATRAVFQTDERDFDVWLPTALSFQATVYLWEVGSFEGGGYHNVYVNFSSYTPLKMGGKNAQQINAIGSYTITPAFYTISMTLGVPITVNELGSNTVGGFIRLGPFVAGSKNFFSSIFQKSIQETDMYFALKVPLAKPKPTLVKGCPKKF